MSEDFHIILKHLVESKFKSQRAFIRIAEPTANEDGAQSYLSKVIAGSKPPPLERIEAWADALGLVGEGRQEFIDLAALEHLHTAVRPMYERIFSEHREFTAATKSSKPKAK